MRKEIFLSHLQLTIHQIRHPDREFACCGAVFHQFGIVSAKFQWLLGLARVFWIKSRFIPFDCLFRAAHFGGARHIITIVVCVIGSLFSVLSCNARRNSRTLRADTAKSLLIPTQNPRNMHKSSKSFVFEFYGFLRNSMEWHWRSCHMNPNGPPIRSWDPWEKNHE